MPLYNYPRDENPNMPLPQYLRRPNSEVDETIAMHWDGTYRDRVRNTQDRPVYWLAVEKNMIARAKTFAKHLA